MPQLFQVLRCYKCSVFQVHQTKKSDKWHCKLCDEKQSMKRHYGLGTAKDCRLHVQKLNGIRGENDVLTTKNSQNDSDDEGEYNEPTTIASENPSKKSKWSDYVDDTEDKTEYVMNSGSTEVVLEVTKGKRKLKNKSFKVPKKNIDPEEEIPRYTQMDPEVQRDRNGCEEILNKKRNSPTQESFDRDNYYKTQSGYNRVLEKPINNKASFKVRTDISSAVNKPIQEIQSHTPSAFIPPKVNKNSRWAQYVDSDENNEEQNSDVFKSHKDLFDSNKDSQSLFSLCDDKDLDDVLDI